MPFLLAKGDATVARPGAGRAPPDVVEVQCREKDFPYRVVSTEIVGPKDVQVLESAGRDTLTLVTCDPFDFLGAAPKRFMVRADGESCSREGSR